MQRPLNISKQGKHGIEKKEKNCTDLSLNNSIYHSL